MIESVKTSIHESTNFIRKVTSFQPQLGLILGSGFSDFVNKIDAISTIHSSEIPHFPFSSVEGHAGKLIFGYMQKDTFHSMPLLVFQGRIHYYETGSIEKAVFPILLSRQLGIKKLIITNAAGAINSCFKVGDLMLIEDILNFDSIQLPINTNNLLSPSRRYSKYFDPKMRQLILQSASQIKISLQHGTYGWLKGPSYETTAEIQMLKRLGVDAVGMSTVPEILLAHCFGMKIAGLSLVSNLATGISSEKLTHAEVIATGTKVSERFSELMEQLVLSLKQ